MSRDFATAAVPPTASTPTEALAQAAAAARYAPSIHNTQPWRWRVGDGGLDLYLEPRRGLRATDRDGRLAVLSCGAALYHARTAVAGAGWRVEVVELPDPLRLAHLSILDRQPVTPEAAHRARLIRERHTDRRPVAGTPIDDDRLLTLVVAVRDERSGLHLLPRDRLVELGSAMRYAQRVETGDAAWRAELARWSGGTRPEGSGVPDAVIPDRPTRTTVPSRDFGHPGELAVGTGHDLGARYAILHGTADAPLDWLRAGQALSAAWLTATDLGVALLPMSAAVEVAPARQVLRRLLAGPGEPFLVLRLGMADPAVRPAGTPRLASKQTVDRG